MEEFWAVVERGTGVDGLLPALGFCALWTSLYFAICFTNRSATKEWNVRLVTFLHALVILVRRSEAVVAVPLLLF